MSLSRVPRELAWSKGTAEQPPVRRRAPDDIRARRVRDRRPVFVIGPGLVAALGAVSGIIAVLTWLAPLTPERGSFWEQVRQALRPEEAQTLPTWWTSALFLVVTVTAFAAAGAARRGARRGRAFAWVVVALCTTWISLDHSMGLHPRLHTFTEGLVPGLPGRHPVESVLVLLIVPSGWALAARSSAVQRLLLAATLCFYLLGSVVIGAGVVNLPLSPYLSATAESTLEWVALVLLAWSASLERGR
jgi:hypothetical protein